jgi:hypothetical protein
MQWKQIHHDPIMRTLQVRQPEVTEQLVTVSYGPNEVDATATPTSVWFNHAPEIDLQLVNSHATKA